MGGEPVGPDNRFRRGAGTADGGTQAGPHCCLSHHRALSTFPLIAGEPNPPVTQQSVANTTLGTHLQTTTTCLSCHVDASAPLNPPAGGPLKPAIYNTGLRPLVPLQRGDSVDPKRPSQVPVRPVAPRGRPRPRLGASVGIRRTGQAEGGESSGPHLLGLGSYDRESDWSGASRSPVMALHVS